MTKSIKELRQKIKPEIQSAAREKAAGIVAGMHLGRRKKSPRDQKRVASPLAL